jgi:hypothetical protein
VTTDGQGSARRARILLGHLGARGDCVYATAVARQIKHDFPGSHLTWAIGSMARGIIAGNPDVDDVWEIPVAGHDEMLAAWDSFMTQLRERQSRGEFDHVFLTQIFPDNFGNYDGTVRASIFRGYPNPITVPVTPVIRLDAAEVETTAAFVARHGLAGYRNVILFESGASSGQSFVTPDFARRAAAAIVARVPETAVVISSNVPFASDDPRIIDGSPLPFRCNAELTKACALLIGCSSGISWLATSDWAKPLPSVQLLRRETSVYASFVHDHERFGLPTESIIEMTDCPPERVADCVQTILVSGVPAARAAFHETLPLRFDFYAQVLVFALGRGGVRTVLKSAMTTMRRYGPHPQLFAAVARLIWRGIREWPARRRELRAARR